jgi:hypothetical protein
MSIAAVNIHLPVIGMACSPCLGLIAGKYRSRNAIAKDRDPAHPAAARAAGGDEATDFDCPNVPLSLGYAGDDTENRRSIQRVA